MLRSEIGLIGLGVMGQGLAVNMAGHGHRVSVFNPTPELFDEFMRGRAAGYPSIAGAADIPELVDSLECPRRIMLMIKSGPPVDSVLSGFVDCLSPGDIIIDAGNSHFKDTIRRALELKARGLLYLGIGISGGEEGALHGPSIMAGGSEEAWRSVENIFSDIAARAGEAVRCSGYLGPDGSGHFVKMVHNGIEYASMQLIAEAYDMMRCFLRMNPEEISDVFRIWNTRRLQSYLVEITSNILAHSDGVTGKPMVDMIKDVAQQKGTGMWSVSEALELGVPVPTIAAAVEARNVSALKEQRERASRILAGPGCSSPLREAAASGKKDEKIEEIENALYASLICAYAQGFALLYAASMAYGWNLDSGQIASLWTGGCIIRAGFLNQVGEAFDRDHGLCNLLLDEFFADQVASCQDGWRSTIAASVNGGLPTPAMASALSYYDSCRSSMLPANLIQAQRDYFGAHTYERLDTNGAFHTHWPTGRERPVG